jgi:hypothetical protein
MTTAEPEPEPWIDRPDDGGRRRRQRYLTEAMRAEEPDRERHRDLRARREMRERAERIFTIHGTDEV